MLNLMLDRAGGAASGGRVPQGFRTTTSSGFDPADLTFSTGLDGEGAADSEDGKEKT